MTPKPIISLDGLPVRTLEDLEKQLYVDALVKIDKHLYMVKLVGIPLTENAPEWPIKTEIPNEPQ